MKTHFRAALAGGLLGTFLTSWLGPRVITWWFEPPVALNFSCRDPIAYALQRLQLLQTIGIVAGAILGIIVLRLLKRTEPALPQSSTHNITGN